MVHSDSRFHIHCWSEGGRKNTKVDLPTSICHIWQPETFNAYPLVMTNIAIENGHRNCGFSHWTWWFSIAMLNYQRVLFVFWCICLLSRISVGPSHNVSSSWYVLVAIALSYTEEAGAISHCWCWQSLQTAAVPKLWKRLYSGEAALLHLRVGQIKDRRRQETTYSDNFRSF